MNNLRIYDSIFWFDHGYAIIFPESEKSNITIISERLREKIKKETAIIKNLTLEKRLENLMISSISYSKSGGDYAIKDILKKIEMRTN